MFKIVGNTLRATLVASSLLLSAGIFTSPALANERDAAVKAISAHFTNVPTMKGEFIQFGPDGEQTGGLFYIQRPGRMRLDYEQPSPLKLISDGKVLAVNNKKLKTTNHYPLRKTPLSLLLSDKISINDKSIRDVSTQDGVTTVVMGDKSIFGDSQITLLFDPANQELRQWTVKDAQGKETSVLILNVEKNIPLSKQLFTINKKRPRHKTHSK